MKIEIIQSMLLDLPLKNRVLQLSYHGELPGTKARTPGRKSPLPAENSFRSAAASDLE